VFGSYLDAVASALMAWFFGAGMLCNAPSAYAAPEPSV